ncbi:MAG: hypothetical protein NC485_06890 [Ruminococcus flavefaciens]|nr:hypothetical protein [Ruminococcus flavefaciens]MCM1062624.1 hypothetical protein [Eubacterium sp.]
MTDKELHKLKKTELLELLFTMRKEIDLLQTENNDLKKQLDSSAADREILKKIFHAVCPNEKEGSDSK